MSAPFFCQPGDIRSRDGILATLILGGVRLKAFLGEPGDDRGQAVPCHYCDRRARDRIGPTRCSRHKPDGSLYSSVRQEAIARRRTRARLRGLV